MTDIKLQMKIAKNLKNCLTRLLQNLKMCLITSDISIRMTVNQHIHMPLMDQVTSGHILTLDLTEDVLHSNQLLK